MHLRERRTLQERKGDYAEEATSDHGPTPFKSPDHLNATFIPATNVRGEPA
ncbi:hypothetical protein ACVW04_004217 [Bradyrhizobium sp. LM2.3]